jgi:hypothetical protein
MPKFINKFPNKTYVINPDRNMVVDGRFAYVPGKKVKFENGELITEDKEVIAHLKKHNDFGITMFLEEPKKKIDDKDPGAGGK